MISFKLVIVFVILHEELSHSIEWIPISSPKILQSYLPRGLQIMKPPYVLREFRPSVDFKKSKTQVFYKATLPVHQSPVYEFRYKIHDPKEENYQEKSEVRIGDSVKGYYRWVSDRCLPQVRRTMECDCWLPHKLLSYCLAKIVWILKRTDDFNFSVREPNGYIRLVKYVSDENGFQTQVSHHHVDDNDGGGYLFNAPRYIT